MSIIDEIRRQRNLAGRNYAKRVLLSPSAFEQLLVEKERLSSVQFDTENIPPTIYGMSISLTDEHGGAEVSVIVNA